jgi:sialate O-acetylesterase
MICTVDIGMQNDIHPKNKYDVGERLALWALRDVYGKKDVVVSGPLFKSMEIKGNQAILSFDYAKGLMTANKTGLEKPVKTDAKPAHFAIAGADKVWYWADAKIEGEKVILSSDKVKTPVAVRYAYRAYPDGVNMYNAAGLPMVPFHTDNW